MEAGNALVINQDEELRITIKHYLNTLGYSASSARTTEDALRVIRFVSFDVIVAPTRLIKPDMTGPNFLRKVLEETSRLPRCIIVGNKWETLIDRKVGTQMIPFVRVPVHETDFAELLPKKPGGPDEPDEKHNVKR